jgi:predicted dithiol-disulfide oxidoreductase (DUF899 family)
MANGPHDCFIPAAGESLADRFDGRTQLGCWADNFNGAIVHLNQRNMTMVVVSEAPLHKLEVYRRRMGWSFTWVSLQQNEFNRDFCVSFTPEEVAASRGFYNCAMQDPRSTLSRRRPERPQRAGP